MKRPAWTDISSKIRALTILALLQACSQLLHRPAAPLFLQSGTQLFASLVYRDHSRTFKKLRARIVVLEGTSIQFSIRTPWGPEVLRGRITPEGLEIVNHTQRTHWAGSYADAQRYQGCLWNYDLIESMLLGKLLGKNQSKDMLTAPWQLLDISVSAGGVSQIILDNGRDDTRLHLCYEGTRKQFQDKAYERMTLACYPATGDGFTLTMILKKRSQLANRSSGRFVVPSHYEKT